MTTIKIFDAVYHVVDSKYRNCSIQLLMTNRRKPANEKARSVFDLQTYVLRSGGHSTAFETNHPFSVKYMNMGYNLYIAPAAK